MLQPELQVKLLCIYFEILNQLEWNHQHYIYQFEMTKKKEIVLYYTHQAAITMCH